MFRTGPLAFLASLCALMLGATPAAAGLVDEVLPQAPQVEVPTQPLPSVPPPVQAPSPPAVPPLQTPTPTAPESPAPAAPSAAVEGAAAEAEEAAGAVNRLPSEVAGKLPAGSQSGSGATAGAPDPARGEQGGATVGAQRPESSIEPATVAPVRRLLAYVWPAVALDFADVGLPLLVRLAASAGIPVAEAFGLLSGLLPGDVAGAEASSGHQATPKESLPSPSEVLLGGGMGLLLILVTACLVVVGLLAGARLLVGEELFEPRRWRHHRSH
jgi:hypothetical protein